MRIVFLGTGRFGEPALRALVQAGHEVRCAISQPDRPAHRGLRVRPTPIHAAADALRIPHIQAEDVNAPELFGHFATADVVIVAAFGQKIGRAILDATPHGCLNLHASLLPRYRGAAPYQWAIINGDATTGVTVFRLNEQWDAGDVLAARETPIGETETADELHDRLSLLAAPLIVETLERLRAGDLRPVPQDPTRASRAPRLSRADGVVDWSAPASAIVRRIHGLWSWPAATCTFASRSGRREQVQLARAALVDPDAPPDADHPPGAFRSDRSVQTGRGRVRLLEVRPAGGKLMSFDAFAHGRHIEPPDRWLPTGP